MIHSEEFPLDNTKPTVRQNYDQADLIRVRDRALAGSSRAEANGDAALAARLFEMAMSRDAWLEEKIKLGED